MAFRQTLHHTGNPIPELKFFFNCNNSAFFNLVMSKFYFPSNPSSNVKLLLSLWSQPALPCSPGDALPTQLRKTLPKHLSLPVNVCCLAMWSDFVKIAPSYSTNLLPECPQVTSSFSGQSWCRLLSAGNSRRLGKGSKKLCFKTSSQVLIGETWASFEGKEGSDFLSWCCWKMHQKKSRSLVGDVEIKISEMFFP